MFRFLGQNTVSAYQRAKVGALSIENHVTTISGNVTVDVKSANGEANVDEENAKLTAN